jgi:hypothetical protein
MPILARSTRIRRIMTVCETLDDNKDRLHDGGDQELLKDSYNHRRTDAYQNVT